MNINLDLWGFYRLIAGTHLLMKEKRSRTKDLLEAFFVSIIQFSTLEYEKSIYDENELN